MRQNKTSGTKGTSLVVKHNERWIYCGRGFILFALAPLQVFFISLGLEWVDIEWIDCVYNNLSPITKKCNDFI
jgi:hypothetical protein